MVGEKVLYALYADTGGSWRIQVQCVCVCVYVRVFIFLFFIEFQNYVISQRIFYFCWAYSFM